MVQFFLLICLSTSSCFLINGQPPHLAVSVSWLCIRRGCQRAFPASPVRETVRSSVRLFEPPTPRHPAHPRPVSSTVNSVPVKSVMLWPLPSIVSTAPSPTVTAAAPVMFSESVTVASPVKFASGHALSTAPAVNTMFGASDNVIEAERSHDKSRFFLIFSFLLIQNLFLFLCIKQITVPRGGGRTICSVGVIPRIYAVF